VSASVRGAPYQNHKAADDISGSLSFGLSVSFPVLVASILEEGDEVSVEGGKRLEMAVGHVLASVRRASKTASNVAENSTRSHTGVVM